jgi:iron complex outermembrane recepter protein
MKHTDAAVRNTRGCAASNQRYVLIAATLGIIMACIGQAAPGFAQPPVSDTKSVRLDPVLVTATRVASESDRVPAALSTVLQEDIQQGRAAIHLDDALNRVPGVFVQNEYNFAQDLRISIRGFGARSAFGIRGIQVYMDGIPLTLPDGQSALDIIDPDAVSQMEVMRGPISPLYGNASGGVINIITQEGPQRPFIESRGLIGEHGLWKVLLKGGGQKGGVNSFAALSHVQSKGFREHSRAESTVFSSKLRVDIDNASDLSLLINAVRTPEAKDPGGLTAAQAATDPRQASALNLLYNTGESIAEQRVGLVYRRELTARQHMEAAGFIGRRELENAIPFRFIELDRKVAGGRLQYDAESVFFGFGQRLVSGIELQHQADDRRNYDNIDGQAGSTLLLDQDESVTSLGVYLQGETELTPRWSILAGGRYDNVRFSIDDRLTAEGNDSGSRTFDQFTGRFGLIYRWMPDIRIYGNIAQSFETPTTTEVVNRPAGGGGINPEIQPQTAVNYEIGTKMGLGSGWTLDTAIFRIDLKDELIAFRDASDRVFYRNAGESRRFGAEVGLTRTFRYRWRLHMAYTYLNAEFESYEKGGVDLAGNDVPGLPRHRLFTELRYQNPSGFYTSGDVRYVHSFFVDDENTLKNDAYALFNARLGFEKKSGRWNLEPFAGVDNLLDKTYNANVRINAGGGRYFEPAPGRAFYGGVRLHYGL